MDLSKIITLTILIISKNCISLIINLLHVYQEESVLFNERIIKLTKSMEDIMVLYPIMVNVYNTFTGKKKQKKEPKMMVPMQ